MPVYRSSDRYFAFRDPISYRERPTHSRVSTRQFIFIYSSPPSYTLSRPIFAPPPPFPTTLNLLAELNFAFLLTESATCGSLRTVWYVPSPPPDSL